MNVTFESLGLDQLSKKHLIEYAGKFIGIEYPNSYTKQRIVTELKSAIWFIQANNPEFFKEF